jgi:transposase
MGVAMKKYIVRLTDEERQHCRGLLRKGFCAAIRRTRAAILLKADADGPGWSDQSISEALDCAVATVENIRKRFVLEGFEAALERKPQVRPSRQRKLDGRGEAHLIALACGDPPDGRERWTLKLLAGRLVQLEVVESISDQTVRRTLKKTRSSPTCANAG